MKINPFAPEANGGEPDIAPADTEPTDAAVASDEPAPEDVDDDAEPAPVSVDEDTEFGSFEKVDKTKQKTVPYSRFAKVVSGRNDARLALSEAEKSLAAVNAKLEALEGVTSVVSEKYRANPDLLKFDSEFMETFEQLAKTDPNLAKAAEAVKAAMNGVKPVQTDPKPTPEADEQPEVLAPAVAKIFVRDAKNTITSALSEHGVKPHFIEAVARDVIANVDAEDLADLTPAQAVEMAKIYFKDLGVGADEFLAPKKQQAPKPETRGKTRPAAAPTGAGDGGEEPPKFKTREEFDAARSKRFAALVRESFGQ